MLHIATICYAIRVRAMPSETFAIWGYGPKSGITDDSSLAMAHPPSPYNPPSTIVCGATEWAKTSKSVRTDSDTD